MMLAWHFGQRHPADPHAACLPGTPEAIIEGRACSTSERSARRRIAMHCSPDPLAALALAEGPMCSLVETGGLTVEHDRDVWTRTRRHLAVFDAGMMLAEYAIAHGSPVGPAMTFPVASAMAFAPCDWLDGWDDPVYRAASLDLTRRLCGFLRDLDEAVTPGDDPAMPWIAMMRRREQAEDARNRAARDAAMLAPPEDDP